MFRKRFNFLKFAGIHIGIDLSWLFIAILLSWTLAAGYFPFHYPKLTIGTYWLMGIIGMLGLFVCVVLHELGHALVAKHYKMPISQITLFIFGGVAEIKKEPQSAKIEFLMAVAGPIVSILIAIVMTVLAHLGEQFGWPIAVVGVTSYLAIVNTAIVIFNLIPAFPLDGGRIFRAILWAWKKNLGWATKIASRMGAGFGFLLIFFGIFAFISGNLLAGVWLGILGLFLQRAATSSRTQYYVSDVLKGQKVDKFMKKDPISAPPDITVKELIDEYMYQSHHHLYPVVDKGKLLGSISLFEVKSLSADEWEKTPVQKIMVPIRELTTVSSNTDALEAFELMHQNEQATLLVADKGKLVGLLTALDLFKLISLKVELEGLRS